jgi:hypothetical protein
VLLMQFSQNCFLFFYVDIFYETRHGVGPVVPLR